MGENSREYQIVEGRHSLASKVKSDPMHKLTDQLRRSPTPARRRSVSQDRPVAAEMESGRFELQGGTSAAEFRNYEPAEKYSASASSSGPYAGGGSQPSQMNFVDDVARVYEHDSVRQPTVPPLPVIGNSVDESNSEHVKQQSGKQRPMPAPAMKKVATESRPQSSMSSLHSVDPSSRNGAHPGYTSSALGDVNFLQRQAMANERKQEVRRGAIQDLQRQVEEAQRLEAMEKNEVRAAKKSLLRAKMIVQAEDRAEAARTCRMVKHEKDRHRNSDIYVFEFRGGARVKATLGATRGVESTQLFFQPPPRLTRPTCVFDFVELKQELFERAWRDVAAPYEIVSAFEIQLPREHLTTIVPRLDTLALRIHRQIQELEKLAKACKDSSGFRVAVLDGAEAPHLSIDMDFFVVRSQSPRSTCGCTLQFTVDLATFPDEASWLETGVTYNFGPCPDARDKIMHRLRHDVTDRTFYSAINMAERTLRE